MSNLTLNVNGKMHTLDVEPSTPLLYILRNDLGLQGPRFGCGLPVRAVYGDRQRRGGAIVHHPGLKRQRGDHDARRTRQRWQASSAAAGLD